MQKADGSVIIDISLKTSSLDSGMERIEEEAKALGIAVEKVGDKLNLSFSGFDLPPAIQNAAVHVEQLRNKLQNAADMINDFQNAGDAKSTGIWVEKYNKVCEQLQTAQRRLTQVVAAEAKKQAAAEEKAAQKQAAAAEKAAAKAIAEREKQAAAAEKAAQKQTESEKKESEKQSNAALKSSEKFLKRISKMAKNALIFNVISKAFRSVTNYFSSVFKQNKQLSTEFAKLKGSLLTLIQPLLDVVIPALTKIVTALKNATNYAIGFVAALMGKSASELSKNAEAIYEEANAINEVATASKNAGKSLAGFDEITTLSGKDEGSSSSESAEVSVIFPEFDDSSTKNLEKAVKSFLKDLEKDVSDYADLFQPTIDAWTDAFKDSDLGGALDSTFEQVKSSATSLWQTGLQPLGTYFTEEFVPNITNSTSQNLAPMFSDVMSFAVTDFGNDFSNTTRLMEQECENMKVALGAVEMVTEDTTAAIDESWQTHGESILEETGEMKSGLWDTFWGINDTIIQPVFGKISDTFTNLWKEHLAPLWDKLVEFFMSLWDNILVLWNNVLKPVIDWLIDFLAPIVTDVINTIIDVVSTVLGIIADVIGGIIEVVDGIITFITGVFSGDWDRAWEGVKKIFKGIWDAIAGILKGVINVIITAINSALSGIYAVVGAVVNAVGGVVKWFGHLFGQDDWGFTFDHDPPQIPKLAQGAVLPANQPFLAMVGDQKHGTNIEAPLTTIQEAVALVMEDMTDGMMAGFEALLEENQRLRAAVEGIEVGDSTIGQAANRYNQRMAIIRG